MIFCEYHQSVGHHIDNCCNLKHTIYGQIDKGIITIKALPVNITNIMINPLPQHHKNDEATNSQVVNLIECEKYEHNIFNGVANHLEQKNVIKIIEVLGVVLENQINLTQSKKSIKVLGVREHVPKPMVIMGPKPIEILGKPAITSLNQIYFNYNQIHVCTQLSNMTRSDRVYKPSYLTKKSLHEDSKAKETLKNQVRKESGYDVVSQLKKTKAEISMWEFFVKSPTHYQALQKVFQSVNVPAIVDTKDLEILVGKVYKQNITFSDNELSYEKEKHNQPLYIKV